MADPAESGDVAEGLARHLAEMDALYSDLYLRGYSSGGGRPKPLADLLDWAIPEMGEDPASWRVIDCGCGDAPVLREKHLPKEYCGVDIAAGVIERNRKRMPGRRFERASITDLPFDDGAFDVALCSDVLEHVAEPYLSKAIREISRVAPVGLWGVCLRASVEGPRFGVGELHISLLDVKAWLDLFSDHTIRARWAPWLYLYLITDRRPNGLWPFRNRHEAQPAVILGSGPSLRHLEAEQLKAFVVFAVNAACLKHPDCNDYYVSADARVTTCEHWFALDDQRCELFLLAPGGFGLAMLSETKVHRSHIFTRQPDKASLTMDARANGTIQATSSAHDAVHIAHIMGCRPIILVGCDCAPEDDRHYFTDFPDEPSDEVIRDVAVWSSSVERQRGDQIYRDGFLSCTAQKWQRIAEANPHIRILDASNIPGSPFPTISLNAISRNP